MPFRIKFSENMARQLPEPKETFPTRKMAERYGVQKYGSGSFMEHGNGVIGGWEVVSVGKGWHGDTPGHRKAALKAERAGAINEPIRTGGKNMGEIHHIKLDELIDSAKPAMHAMLDQALNSGALTEEMKEDNFLLAKAIITIWSRKESYAPRSPQSKKEVKNLEHFI